MEAALGTWGIYLLGLLLFLAWLSFLARDWLERRRRR